VLDYNELIKNAQTSTNGRMNEKNVGKFYPERSPLQDHSGIVTGAIFIILGGG
jgi:hypothetical protein